MISIRKFMLTDTQDIALLMADLGYATSDDKMLIRMKRIESDPMCCTLVAVYNNKVVGMIGLRKISTSYEYDDEVVHITALVTNIDYRKKGIGKELIKEAENWAKENGAKGIVLTSGIKPEREDAHRFYKHVGFDITGYRFTKYLGTSNCKGNDS